MNRRGMSILADLGWLLTYIIIAVLCYAFLYSQITDRYTDQLTSENSEALAGNAQYIANALLAHKAIAGTTEAAPATFADSISTLGTAYERALAKSPGITPLLSGTGTTYVAGADLDAFPKTVEGSAYKATLDSVFGPQSAFWKPTGFGPNVESIVVVLRQTGKQDVIAETCLQYTRQGIEAEDICDQTTLGNIVKVTLSAAVPSLSPVLIGDARGYNSEYGFVHVPTSEGSVSLLLTEVWKG